MFREVSERKKTIKTSAQKTPKICLFPNGLVHGFCQKMDILLTFVFMQNGSRKSVFSIF